MGAARAATMGMRKICAVRSVVAVWFYVSLSARGELDEVYNL